MTDFKTELETGELRNATVLESGGDFERTVLEPIAAGVRDGRLTKGEFFGANYQIVDPLCAFSAEADLYIVERPPEARRYILKLYRYGTQPKRDILEKVQALRREHIVEIIETGELGGSHYEIQEYIEHGSLADLLKEGLLSEPQAIEVLKEITDALAHLHEVDVLHRDIKPSNILVRNKVPTLDLVLTDFGISSVTDLSMVYTEVRRTPAYSAPEASTPVLVKKATDWWSVGIILIEVLTGRHPFAGMNELGISLHLATKPAPIPSSLAKDWQLIIKGLLTRDPRKRWGIEQISEWLQGKRNMPIHFENEVANTAYRYSYRPYRFGGRDFFDLAELATALAENWDEAVKRVGRLDILKWVKEHFGDADIANALQDVADDKNLNEYQKVTVSLLVLNPQLPAIWEDAVISLEWMQANPEIAVKILESSVPSKLQALRNDSWMVELRERKRQIWAKLNQVPKINRELANRLILGAAEIAHAEAKTLRETIFSSESQVVDQALRKPEIDDADAILLASCHRSLLWSKEQEVVRQAEAARRERESEIAESERRRKIELEEENQRKSRARYKRFNLANILGWASLGTIFLGPFINIIGVLLSIVAAYFIFDYWRHASYREKLKGGHKVAFGVVIILVCAIIFSLIRGY
jgi:hypothetical protein